MDFSQAYNPSPMSSTSLDIRQEDTNQTTSAFAQVVHKQNPLLKHHQKPTLIQRLPCSRRFFLSLLIATMLFEVVYILYSNNHLRVSPSYKDVTGNLDLTSSTPDIFNLSSQDLFMEVYEVVCESDYTLTTGMVATDRFKGVISHNSTDTSNETEWPSSATNMDANIDIDLIMGVKNYKRFMNSSRPPDDKERCPCVSPDLKGQLHIALSSPPIGEIELAHPELRPGGVWRPSKCRARQNIALIVPFRDREEHLQIFLNHIHPLLQNQMLSYRIIVVEQMEPDIFNKAQMMNIGYLEAKKLDNFDCYIFHDVDMLPEDDRNMYTCSMSSPRHVGAFCDKWDYNLAYVGIFGGATAFTGEQFEKVNGYATHYYGWGGEDDDMYRRTRFAGLSVERYPKAVARYTMIKHTGDKRNPYNRRSNVAWRYRPRSYQSDGLISMQYRVTAREYRPLYTWLYAVIPAHRE